MSALRSSTNNQNKNGSNPPPTAKRSTSFQSLNHLTNFSLPPRTQHPVHNALPRRSRKPIAAQVWNKEKFVNAQYRFVMKPTGDYTVHFADPDIFFQWEDILQVIIPPTHYESLAKASETHTPDAQTGSSSASSEPSLSNCPICLSSPPVAPRVTKCGHIFCFPCILRYLSLGTNPKWNRCPICFDSVTEKHLKCVAWQQDQDQDTASQAPRDDSVVSNATTLTMRLIERPQITTLALPRSSSWPSDLIPPHQAPFHFLPDVTRFAKFMLATPSYIIANLTQELDQLEHDRQVLTSDEQFKDELGFYFIEVAETKIKRQIEKATNLDMPPLRTAIEKAEKGVRNLEQLEHANKSRSQQQGRGETQQEVWEVPEALLASQKTGVASGSSILDPGLSSIAQRPQKSRRNVNPPPHSTSTYYFYQAANGAPVFLHPLDIRILHSHFKSYNSFPDTITFNINPQLFTMSTINNDLRKRCKYLAHLPEAADVVFIEAGWELENIVGPEDLKPFEAALKMRVGKRKEKERREDRAKARAEERERESILRSARVPSTPVSHDNSYELSHLTLSSSPPGSDEPPVDMEPDEAVGSTTPSRTQASAPAPAPATTTTTPRAGAWGTRSFATAIASAPPSAPATPAGRRTTRRSDDLDPEDAQWEQEIDAAWHELESSMLSGPGGGGRKKRGKKLVLLTAGRRGS